MVILEPMSEVDFQSYLDFAVADYAQEHVKSGRWSQEEALEQSRKQYAELLPNGVASPDQYLFTIVDPDHQRKVGILWFAREARAGQHAAFVYDVRIDEEYRHQGYGSQAFLEMEKKVRDLGLSRIGLHVFGHNQPALAMYQKLGYVATNIVMAKDLD
ncbi:GNAT family N-acetyltransferase [Dictyobacter aurantiacus]|uniref:N-acetyltransferase n=1 Tax=Dictyobacter aurantiacus TaxID=1936993 RepID=A0A401ZKV1_9CHLR|nr:GNAT family N-acetyltransferase [Dictyobacter aurantiacus]GCE07440.1 N-acetyltransferase [Dictyobacter aurantiacus]